MSSAPDAAGVVSLAARRAYRPDYRGLACAQVRAGREKLGLNHDEFAEHLGRLLGRKITGQLAKRWEQGSVPPGDVLLAANGHVPARSLLEGVPPGFPAGALAGPWVTVYRFSHDGEPRHHADVAHVAAVSEDRVRAVNHPPEPRSEGRATPFSNEIEAGLFGRHLIGQWRNSSDTRYYGTLELAVLPGETVMQGGYYGVGSDIDVSAAPWKWVRLDPGPVPAQGITLREPGELYDLVMAHSQLDAPLALDQVREEP